MTRQSSLDVALVYSLIFVSGSMLSKQASEKYLILAFVFSLLAWVFSADRKLSDRFLVYVCIFGGFLFTISLYTESSLQLVSVISTTMKLVLAYLVLKTVRERFIDTYINVAIFLAVFSLFGYLTDMFHLFDSVIRRLPEIGGGNGYEGILFAYRRNYAGSGRNASIFFEPGAYQIFLNAAIFLILFAKTGLDSSRRWIYLSILVITLITTTSTTGYMIFFTMVGLFLFRDKSISFIGKASVIGLILVVALAFSAQLNTLIIEKIGDDILSVQSITDSTHRRGFDAMVDMEIFKRHIFGVGHKKYAEEFSALGLVTMSSAMNSSNGITKTLAIYGLPFTFFIFASYYWALGRLVDGFIINIVAFGMLLVFFTGEATYVLSPFTLAIIAAAFVYDGSRSGVGVSSKPEFAS